MRVFLFACLGLTLSLGLAACAPRGADEAACALSATQTIAFSSAAATDVIEARAEGPSCAQAVLTLSLRNAGGDPLWVFAGTYYDMAFGGVPPEGAEAVDAQEMDRFLKSWADVTVSNTGALPAWAEGAEAPASGENGIAYETPLDRDTYEALRAGNAPQLCYAAAVAATECIVLDPVSLRPTLIAAYGA